MKVLWFNEKNIIFNITNFKPFIYETNLLFIFIDPFRG